MFFINFVQFPRVVHVDAVGHAVVPPEVVVNVVQAVHPRIQELENISVRDGVATGGVVTADAGVYLI